MRSRFAPWPHVLQVGRIAPQPTWSMPWHVHPRHHELIVVVSGRIETEIAGQRVVGEAGDVLFYPRGAAHAERAVGPTPLETYFVGWHAARAVTAGVRTLVAADPQGRILGLVRWMHELAADRRPGHQQTLDALLHAAWQAWRGHPRAAHDPLVEQTRAYVQAHLAEPLSLADLARAAGLSRFHFARRFRAAAGCPPMHFVTRLRVEAARGLILHGVRPHRVVAELVGLGDEYHFSRVFRRITGQPPARLQPHARPGRPPA